MTEHDVDLIDLAKRITLEDLPMIVARVALTEAVEATRGILDDEVASEEERKGAIDTLRQDGGEQLCSIAKSFLKTFVPNLMVEAKKDIKELAPSYVLNVSDDGKFISPRETALVYSSAAVAVPSEPIV